MLSFFSTLRNKQISLFMFNFIIAIWLGAILNFGFYKKVHLLTPYLGIKATFFLAATVVIVVATYYA
ncbi:MAG: lipid A phosphoethanolamine transferase, partial [Acinetobacter sp.]|nr:lipid A phosphoethanolamine transferase [Acinetobacter sp.]